MSLTPIDIKAARAALSSGKNPDIFVFDLDYTLWPFDCEKDMIGPFYSNSDGVYDYRVYDSRHQLVNTYRDVPDIMAVLYDANIPVAFLSRNPSHASLEQLLKTIPMQTMKGPMSLWYAMPDRKYFQAYSTMGAKRGKNLHFATLSKLTNVPFENMLFFDDLPENIHYARKQGTTSIELNLQCGLTWTSFFDGLTQWRAR